MSYILETLIIEALLFAKYLRKENKDWIPRFQILHRYMNGKSQVTYSSFIKKC